MGSLEAMAADAPFQDDVACPQHTVLTSVARIRSSPDTHHMRPWALGLT